VKTYCKCKNNLLTGTNGKEKKQSKYTVGEKKEQEHKIERKA
jgi:hypothetical protein